MNFIKTQTPIEGYQRKQQLGSKWVLHMCEEQTSEELYTCIEVMTDHEPSDAEMQAIEAEALEWVDDMQIRSNQAAIQAEVRQLKQNLLDTDYKAIKFAEGWITTEEYAPTKAQRQEWRDRINELENETTD